MERLRVVCLVPLEGCELGCSASGLNVPLSHSSQPLESIPQTTHCGRSGRLRHFRSLDVCKFPPPPPPPAPLLACPSPIILSLSPLQVGYCRTRPYVPQNRHGCKLVLPCGGMHHHHGTLDNINFVVEHTWNAAVWKRQNAWDLPLDVPLTLQGIWTAIQHLLVTRYLIVASFALGFYDYFLTLPDEQAFVWKSRPSVVRSIYFFVRYSYFPIAVLTLYGECSLSTVTSSTGAGIFLSSVYYHLPLFPTSIEALLAIMILSSTVRVQLYHVYIRHPMFRGTLIGPLSRSSLSLYS